MRYTNLGATSGKVPVVGIGLGKGIGSQAKTAVYGREDEDLIRLGIDLGLNFIDTAPDYGMGAAEEALGRALVGIREKVFVATKFPPAMSAYDDVIKSAEQSLKRLRTDRIELFQSHWPNPAIPLEETMRAMARLVKDGKVRHIGLCNCTPGEAKTARQALPADALVSIQHEYNLLDRSAEEALIPFCMDNRLTFISYSPLAHTRLESTDQRLSALAGIAARYSLGVTQLVLTWLTRQAGTIAVMRTSSAHHLRENARVGDIALSPEDIEALSAIFASVTRPVSAARMWVRDDGSGKVYTTLEAARANVGGLTPSPAELARQILAGEILKPIKVQENVHPTGGQSYEVIEGKLRYWAWVIAHGPEALVPTIIK